MLATDSFDQETVDAYVDGEGDEIFLYAWSDFVASFPVHIVGAQNMVSIQNKHLLNE